MFGKFALRDQIISWVDRAIDVQDDALRTYLGQTGEHPGPAVPDGELAASLEGQYLATVSGAGAAVGGAASIPGVGTGLAVGLSVAETVAFLDATALFALASAEAKGCRLGDLPRRRALLLLALLGDDAVRLLPQPAQGGSDGWGRRLAALDDATLDEVNRTAEKWLLTRFGPRQGMFIVGRLVPFGIGAAVGAAGNALTAKGVIARVRSAFAGPASALRDPEPVAELVAEPVVELVAEPVAPAAEVLAIGAASAAEAPSAVAEPAVAPPTGKYAGLHAYLRSVSDDEVALPFATLDAVVTGGLPSAARRNPGWWGNDVVARAPQTRAWLAADLHVREVDLSGEKVWLDRGPAQPGVGQG